MALDGAGLAHFFPGFLDRAHVDAASTADPAVVCGARFAWAQPHSTLRAAVILRRNGRLRLARRKSP